MNTIDPRSAFKFLDPYGRDDKAIFFGRERETNELHSRVLESGVLVVYGLSGTGKTSLVQCGLAATFEPADCLQISVRRGGDMLESLSAALAQQARTSFKAGASCWEMVRSLYLDHFKPIHLIFDQLEELFIFGGREERKAFGRTLADLQKLEQDVRVILVLREEYLAALTEFEEYLPDIFSHKMRLDKIDRAQARESIKGPCGVAGIGIETGVVDGLLDKLSAGSATVELTFLQVVLDRLLQSETSRPGQTPELTVTGVAALGDLGNVLATFLETQVAAMANPQAAEAVLKALVSTEGTRLGMTLEELGKAHQVQPHQLERQELEALLQQLVSPARILNDQDERGRYELRHDSLARTVWERMTVREKEIAEIRQMLAARYRVYESSKRKVLLGADTLQVIAPYADSLYLDPPQAQFLAESHKAETRRRRRALRFIAAGVIVVVVALAGAGITVTLQAREQSRTISLVLTDAAKRAADEQLYDRALRLALIANREDLLRTSAPGAHEQLIRAALNNRLLAVLRGHGDYPNDHGGVRRPGG